jgi:hypothetical protein
MCRCIGLSLLVAMALTATAQSPTPGLRPHPVSVAPSAPLFFERVV